MHERIRARAHTHTRNTQKRVRMQTCTHASAQFVSTFAPVVPAPDHQVGEPQYQDNQRGNQRQVPAYEAREGRQGKARQEHAHAQEAHPRHKPQRLVA